MTAARPTTRRRLRRAAVGLTTLAVAAGAAVTFAPASKAAPAKAPRIYLAEPTGPYQVGTTLQHLVDTGRTDPITGKGERELLAQIWYPGDDTGGHPIAPYMKPKEAAFDERNRSLPEGVETDAPTNSHLDAPAKAGDHPVVLFSHGWCGSRTDTTFIAEELASRGAVVASVTSTHEGRVEFPGGRFVEPGPDECGNGDPGQGTTIEELLPVRVDDTSFLIDQLTAISRGASPDVDGKPVPEGLGDSLDLDRIGMYGHSLGGATTAQAMYEDARIDAGVNLDGLVIGDVQQAGLDRPFLVIGSDWHTPEYDTTWKPFLPALTGWNHWLRVRGAGHYRFVDQGGSATPWKIRETMPAERWRLNFGDIDDRHSQKLVRAYTAAFFDKFLYDRPAPILEGPSPEYPEVVFER